MCATHRRRLEVARNRRSCCGGHRALDERHCACDGSLAHLSTEPSVVALAATSRHVMGVAAGVESLAPLQSLSHEFGKSALAVHLTRAVNQATAGRMGARRRRRWAEVGCSSPTSSHLSLQVLFAAPTILRGRLLAVRRESELTGQRWIGWGQHVEPDLVVDCNLGRKSGRAHGKSSLPPRDR
jgi:hypothetical protein